MNSNSHTETNGNTPDKKLNHVHDPVCGMTVVPDASTAHAEHAGMKYYFCSQGCCDKFVAEPSRYTVGQKAETQPAVVKDNKTIYTCPMHPEVKQPGPGACPKCGMALEPMGVPAAASKTEYTCPMHPEVVQDHPGNCPKCGMTLEPRTVAVEEDDAELRDMTRRFWFSTVLAIPVLFSAMGSEFWPNLFAEFISPRNRQWLEMLLATPVVLWGGWPFFVRGWRS
ncbi:MAG: copper-transporting ATPase, partial [Hydrogenophilales bacterium 17-61-9]